MAVALAEADDLVLDRGAIARAAALDLPGIHRRAMHIGPDDRVGGLGGAGDAALDLRIFDALGQHRERLRRLVAGLHLAGSPSRWCGRRAAAACRSSAARAQIRRAPRSGKGRAHGASPTRPAGVCCSPIWIRPRRNVPVVRTTAPVRKFAAIRQANPGNAPVVDQQVVGLAFDDRQVRRFPDRRLHRSGIKLAVGLGARPPHRRTLAAVEHAELDAAPIGDPAHQAVQRIDLADQMTLAEPADGRIAGHRADRRKPVGHQRRRARPCAQPRPRPRSRRGRRRSTMTSKVIHVKLERRCF